MQALLDTFVVDNKKVNLGFAPSLFEGNSKQYICLKCSHNNNFSSSERHVLVTVCSSER